MAKVNRFDSDRRLTLVMMVVCLVGINLSNTMNVFGNSLAVTRRSLDGVFTLLTIGFVVYVSIRHSGDRFARRLFAVAGTMLLVSRILDVPQIRNSIAEQLGIRSLMLRVGVENVLFDSSLVLIVMGVAFLFITTSKSLYETKEIAGVLRESEHRYRALMESLPVGVFRWRIRDQRLMIANPMLARIFGYDSIDALAGQSVQDLYIDPQDHKDMTRQLLYTEGFREKELRLKKRDGTPIWGAVTASVVRDENGKPAYFEGILQDITNRKRAEETLRGVVEATRPIPGRDFFEALALGLARVLRVRYAFVGQVVEPDRTQVRTLAFCADSALKEKLIYDLAGSPCESVVGRETRYYPRGLQETFPEDAWILEHGIESYLGVPIFGSKGEPLGVMAVMHDEELDEVVPMEALLPILAERAAAEMERRRAEQKLQDSEARFRTLFESANDAIFVADADTGSIIEVNEKATQLLGMPGEEIVGRHLSELHPEEEAEAYRKIFRRYLETGGGIIPNVFVRRADGGQVPVEISAGVADVGGKRIIFGSFRNITKRKRAQERIERNERLYRDALRVAGAVPYYRNFHAGRQSPAKDTYEYVGEEIRTLVGYSPEEFTPKLWHAIREEIVLLGDLKNLSYEQALKKTRAEKDIGWRAHCRVRTRNGEERWLFNAGIQVCNEKGTVIGSLGIFQDITDRKRVEEELTQHRDRLEELVRERTIELATTNRKLRLEIRERRRAEESTRSHQEQLAHASRLSTMGEMASGLAHELNQPLAAISNYVSACVERIQSGTARSDKLLDTMEKTAQQAKRAGEVIRRIRSFVRRDGLFHRSIADINEIVQEAVSLTKYMMPDRAVSIELDIEKQLPGVLVDRIEIEQVILNLVRNGIESMDAVETAERQLIVTTSRRPDNTVGLAVCDRGQGVSAEDCASLFRPFFTTKKSGMGMGLSISRTIIEAHGGRLWATPNHDRGATFRFMLPAGEGGGCR